MMHNDLNRKFELERLKNESTFRLMTSGFDEFGFELSEMLTQLSPFFDLDGAGIHQLSPDGENNCIPIAAHGDAVEFRELDRITWLLGKLGSNRKVVINSLSDLPTEAQSERDLLTESKVASAFIVTLDAKASLFATFVNHTVRNWEDEELSNLEAFAKIIRIAFERQRGELERQLLQEQVYQYQKLEAIGKLTGGIAHDFNNMLVPIIGYADSLLADDDSQNWKEEVSEIRKAAANAADLTRQLLAFSRKEVPDLVELDINGELAKTGTMIRRMLGEDITLVIKPGAQIGSIEGDRGQLQQILMNLCVNARDAMPGGGTITISTESKNNEVVLKVADTGVGMPIEVQERVFDPFFSTKGNGGTGLGLSVVNGIVHQFGGRMQVDSTEGVGTQFSIHFPSVKSLNSQVETSFKSSRSGSSSDLCTSKILLVEDEPAVMAFVKKALSKKGYEIVTAETCTKAIEAFDRENGSFDLIFTDAKLPDGTGIDVLDHVQKHSPEMRALISSGYTDDRALLDQAREMGVQFLQKPYPLDELFETLADALMPKNSTGVDLAA